MDWERFKREINMLCGMYTRKSAEPDSREKCIAHLTRVCAAVMHERGMSQKDAQRHLAGELDAAWMAFPPPRESHFYEPE